MIFVGDGALLRHAIESALARAYRVDGVLGNTDQLRSFCSQRNIPFELAGLLPHDYAALHPLPALAHSTS